MPTMTSGAGKSTTFRTMSVLDVVARSPEPITLTELARRTGLPAATVHRYVHELVDWGSLERTDHGGFILGASMWRLGMAAQRERVIRRAAGPILESLTATTSYTSAVGRIADSRLESIDHRAGKWADVRMLDIGEEIPLLESSAGLVMIADLPQRTIAARFPRVGTDALTRIGPELAKARARRCAVTVGAVFPAQTSLSVPVPRIPGTDRLVITLVMPRSTERPDRHLLHLRMAAATLSVHIAQQLAAMGLAHTPVA